MTTLTAETSRSTQVLDMQQLLDRCMGSLELAERCLVRFEQKLRADVESVQQCVDGDDRPELAQIAHRVKGSAATVAAEGLAKTAGALEDYARGEGAVEPSGLMTDFLGEVERFFESVPQFHPINRSSD